MCVVGLDLLWADTQTTMSSHTQYLPQSSIPSPYLFYHVDFSKNHRSTTSTRMSNSNKHTRGIDLCPSKVKNSFNCIVSFILQGTTNAQSIHQEATTCGLLIKEIALQRLGEPGIKAEQPQPVKRKLGGNKSDDHQEEQGPPKKKHFPRSKVEELVEVPVHNN